MAGLLVAAACCVPPAAIFGSDHASQAPKPGPKGPKAAGAGSIAMPSFGLNFVEAVPASGKTKEVIAARRAAAKQLIVAAIAELQNISDAKSVSPARESIAWAQLKVGDWGDAKAAAAKIKGRKDDLYRGIAEAEAASGDLVGAEATAKLIGDLRIRRDLGPAIVSAQLRTGDLAGACARAAKIAWTDADGCDQLAGRRACAYKEIAETQIKANDKVGAVQSLEAAAAAAARAVPPDVALGLSLEVAEAQLKAGDEAGAVKTVRKAREAARLVPDGAMPWAYSVVFEAQVIAGDPAGAKAAAAQVTERSGGRDLRPMAYEGIVTGQGRTGDVAGAKATAAEIADNDERAAAYCTIACIQAVSGDLAGARATATLAASDRHRGPVQRAIAEAQARAGDIAAANATAAEIKEAFPRTEAYCAIAQAQAKAGDNAGVRQTLDAANASAATITDGDAKMFARCRIARARAEAGDWAGAKATAVGIERALARASVYKHIAEMQVKAGDLPAARETLETAASSAAQLKGWDQARTYRDIAAVHAYLGDLDAAKRNLSRIDDEFYRQHANPFVIVARARAGDVAGAIKLSKRLSDAPHVRCESLARAACDLCPEPYR
jgi:tetratricopeptide (TPR) repeat protein